MTEETLRVLRCDGIESRSERLVQGVGGSGGDLTQPALHFRPGRLDRAEVRRVR